MNLPIGGFPPAQAQLNPPGYSPHRRRKQKRRPDPAGRSASRISTTRFTC